MKINKETLAVIKNFASINPNLMLRAGEYQSTISVSKTLYARARMQEFPSDFGIYDTNDFLSVLSLFDSPELSFQDNVVEIAEPGRSVIYNGAAANVLVVPSKKIEFKECDVEFRISERDIANLQRVASVMRSPDVVFKGRSGSVKAMVGDISNPAANRYELDIGAYTTEGNIASFDAHIKVDNLRVLPTDYTVEINQRKVLTLRGVYASSIELMYVMVLESDSSFE